jgi:colanic acid/amylovoran biosynthesis glycosyltransferase
MNNVVFGTSNSKESRTRKPIIANINQTYFTKSETFMYFYLSHFQNIHPICLSWYSPIINNDLFPFPVEDGYGYIKPQYKRFGFTRLRNAIRKRITHYLWPDIEPALIHQFNWASDILRKRGAVLIHAHYGPVGWRALSLKKSLKLPLITNFYGYDVAPDIAYEGPEWPDRRNQLFERGDLFLVEGPVMREKLIGLGCSPEKVAIQKIAIDIGKIPFRIREPKNGKFVILFTGRFVEKKGLIYALQAIHSIWKNWPNLEFRIIGDGILREQVQSYIEDNRLESCVKLLGFLNHQEYLSMMKEADLLLQPSVTAQDGDSEGGAPTVILEAQAMGIPIISTYHADIPNITIPGKSSILVPERDSEALANAISHLLSNPDLWKDMGENGHNYVKNNHNIEKEVLTLEERYINLIMRNNVRGSRHN